MMKFIKSLLSPRIFSKKTKKLRLRNQKEYTDLDLKITGDLPSWLAGNLVRNCTVPVFEEGKETSHLFDGISMLHSFSIENGRVSYSSRYLHSEGYARVIQSDTEFYRTKIDIEKAKHISDAAVNVFKYNDDFVALTESPLPVRFDVNSLKTLGSFEFEDDLPKKDIWESAHPHYCEDSQELFNYLIDYGPNTAYVLYRINKSSSARKVLARIPVKKPGYMHSFAMTKRYLILVEFPLLVNPLRLLFAKIDSFASYIRIFKWLPKRGTRFLVVEKSSGKLALELKYGALFSFHHANAYEKGDEIVVDLTANNYKKLKAILPNADQSVETMQGLQRFRLNLVEKNVVHENALDCSVEFPTISQQYDGKNYRYLYMVKFAEKDSSLVKYDWQRRCECSWQEKHAKVTEPIFVPAPKASSEDDGVVLTVVSDENNPSSYLLVLNARNLQEIARADLPELLPNSFHGQFFTPSISR